MAKDESTREEWKMLFEYLNTLQDVFEKESMVEKVIKKIKLSISEEGEMASWKKFHQYHGVTRSIWYKPQALVKTINQLTDIFDYFDMQYPDPPGIIERFFPKKE